MIQGILTESAGPDADDHTFTVVDSMSDVNKNSIANERLAEYQMTEEEGESSVASVEEQLKKEMTVYEVWLERKKYWINQDLHFVCVHFQSFECWVHCRNLSLEC